MRIEYARLETLNRIHILFTEVPQGLLRTDIVLAPAAEIHSVEVEGYEAVVTTDDLDLSIAHTVLVRRAGIATIDVTPCLQALRSDLPLGCIAENEYYIFRLFAPRASRVRLHLFDAHDDAIGTQYYLTREADGIWQLTLARPLPERYYAFSIDGPHYSGEMFNSRIRVGDPYARAVVTRNDYRNEARCLIPDYIPAYDWEDDRHVAVSAEDLVIYEMHVKDMTAHSSSGRDTRLAGTYRGLWDGNTGGGLDHIRQLGVNAVELMPSQHFAFIEPPFHQHAGSNLYNDWNPYEANHWGYMTSFFFAPEPRYATGAETRPEHWNTAAPSHVTEFKDMVKALHRAGLAVIMDVVYNHTSEYDYQPLKYIDKQYYFRTSPQGEFLQSSGCGNDLDSRMPMTRRLIVESVLHWLEEYHVDGFRFDLAPIIDRETFEEIRDRAREVYPDVILIAEPWGGGAYDLTGFSELGYTSWNDIFRDGVKGSDPKHHHGYIFGSWGGKSPENFGTWMLGSVREKHGPFLTHAHAVNYLESHDGYTLGDTIRIATGTVRPGQPIGDFERHVRLTPEQLRISKLAAVMLLTARGAVMLHAGQEFARSKVIADTGRESTTPGLIDRNSYEKDDETNWIDYRQREWNRPLFEYYRGLIALRSAYPVLRNAPLSAYHFLSSGTELASGFVIGMDGDGCRIAVLINANRATAAEYILPKQCSWRILVDAQRAGTATLGLLEGKRITVPAGTCMVMVNDRAD